MNKESLRLRIYPDSALRERAQPVTRIDGFLEVLVQEMSDLMYRNQGIGLAAPQVGFLQRLVIMDVGNGLLAMANPEMLHREGSDNLEEGCLSLPDVLVDIDRDFAVTVKGLRPDGEEVRRDLDGLAARVMQHEIDHLDGRLIIDYATPVKKVLLKKQLKALAQQ
ncbi:MAG TPA: peptide deformylase [bacterium]|nr:peptide deformylase [bacterium]